MFSRLHFFLIISAALFFGVFFFAHAQNPFASITFPIPELGNCGSLAECKTYCDDLANKDACIAFGKAHGLINNEDADRLNNLPKTGPGNCASEESCKAYCGDPAHRDECFAFAEAHGLISHDDAERFKKFAGATGPGGCQGEACKTYCNDPSHHEECLKFAEANGLISKDEAARIKKFIDVAKNGGPGGCTSQDSCEAYCRDAAHLDECVKFAEDNGLLSHDAAENVRKLANQTGPGGCQGEACRDYCNDSTHAEECIAFGEKNGLISHEDAVRARKFAGKTGPSGCQGEACRDYCNDQSHQEACLQFALDNGLIPKDEAERTKQFMDAAAQGGPGGCQGQACKQYCEDGAHHEECFNFAKEHNLLPPEAEHNFEVGKKLEDEVHTNGGPGGCKNNDECQAYCSDPAHVDECLAFATVHGGIDRGAAEHMLKEFIRAAPGQQHPPLPGEFESGEEGQFGTQGFSGENNFEKLQEEHLDRFRQFEDLEKKFRGPGFPGEPEGFSGGQGPAGFGGSGGRQQFPTSGFTGGPGGCQGPQECIKYCSDPVNRDECAKFFQEQKGGPPPGALFKQVPPGSESGYHNPQPLPPSFVGPGNCTTPEECKAYCADPAHQSECQTINQGGSSIPSGAPSGAISPPPAGTTAFPCNSYDSCKIYCSDPSHQGEPVCVKLLQPQPSTSGTVVPLPSGGSTLPPPPPSSTTAYPCTSFDSCKVYCSDASHQQENVCVKFLQSSPQSRSEYFWGGFASLGKAVLELFH